MRSGSRICWWDVHLHQQAPYSLFNIVNYRANLLQWLFVWVLHFPIEVALARKVWTLFPAPHRDHDIGQLDHRLVKSLGRFPLPVEVVPMAARRIGRQFEALGGQAKVRMAGGQTLLTDNGQIILDVSGLDIVDPLAFETLVSQWPGVVTVGVFAYQKAQICLLGTADGVRTVSYEDAGLRT